MARKGCRVSDIGHAVQAYVEANGVEVTGALVYAEADDLLRLWENGDVDKIAIDTVLPSKYSAGGTFGWG